MSNKKLGLVLGAGASRGFAHIGVLQALLEADIQIDVVTGCSMGALVGALFVSGSDMYILEKYAQKFDLMKYIDFSVKNGGFVRGKKIEELLRLLTKNKSIGQVDRPFACVAVDICAGTLETFRTGSLYQAVRASISMPGIFTPYAMNGRIFIDGAVLERLPIQAAKDLGADVVIAVDVAHRGQEQPPPKNVIETLRWTLAISDWKLSRVNEKNADLLLVPDVYCVDPFSSKEAAYCVQMGRKAVEDNLAAIRALLA